MEPASTPLGEDMYEQLLEDLKAAEKISSSGFTSLMRELDVEQYPRDF